MMDFSDESYVRKYPRKTVTNRLLKWQGRMVLDAMLGEFDRAGIFELAGDPVECIAAVTEIPDELVRFGLERLVATKTWIVTPDAIVWPTYVEAQTCAKNDRVRQHECRKRRNQRAAAGAPSHGEQSGEAPPASRAVTPSHAPSHGVTPSLSVADPDPNFSFPDRARGRGEKKAEPDIGSDPEPEREAPARTALQCRGYPRGWRWSRETAAIARAEGVTDAQLQRHVNYWTTRKWAVPIDAADLDLELQLTIEAIKDRNSKAKPGASNGSAQHGPYAFVATNDHAAFAKAHELDVRLAVNAYRASGQPDKLGTLRANIDFMSRLRCWAATGEFIPSGPMPKRQSDDEHARGAA
jgi:hypothetical protein